MTLKEQKKILLFVGVVVISVFLVTLRLLTWKWERRGNSPFALPTQATTELNRLWQQATETFTQQTETLKNNSSLDEQNSEENQKIMENLKTKIEQEVNNKQK